MWYKSDIILQRNSKPNDMEDNEITMFTLDLPMYMHPHQISGVRTGYYELNSLLSGWQNNEYVIVGYTYPEDAKEFISNNASAANRFDYKVAVFAPNKDTTYSIVDSENTIVLHDYESIFELIKRVGHLVRKENVKAVFIEDITMLKCPGVKLGTRRREIEGISRSLRQLVRQHDIPIIILVPCMTNDAIPNLNDLKSIGGIEQDADVVIFLTRDINGKLAPLVAKNRSGSVSDIIDNNSDNPVPF